MIKISKKFKKSAGVTLIEGLVVIGILGLIFTASIISIKDKKDRVMFREAEATILRSFEKARNRAETGFGTGDHGVDVSGGTITIFEDNCSVCESDINTMLPASITIIPVPDSEVLFTRLTAETGEDTSINLTSSTGLTSIINIKSDGTITIN
jgi:type II secretory pathway pseudopilin PulG